MDECIFCQIVAGKAPSQIEKETENLIVFKDVSPRAPVHLLIVPKKHVLDISETSDGLWTEVKKTSLAIAKEKNLKGFRLVNNAGQAAYVKHMHVHLLAEITQEREI